MTFVRAGALALAAITLALSTPSAHANGYTASRNYVSPVAFMNCSFGAGVESTSGSGGCFVLDGSEESVTLHIADLVDSRLPVLWTMRGVETTPALAWGRSAVRIQGRSRSQTGPSTSWS